MEMLRYIASTLFVSRLLLCYSCMHCINYCKIQVPSTIPELYAAVLASEKRIIAFCTNEFSKIRKEMKVRYQVVENYIINMIIIIV